MLFVNEKFLLTSGGYFKELSAKKSFEAYFHHIADTKDWKIVERNGKTYEEGGIEKGDHYWFLNSTGAIFSDYWNDCEGDRFRKHTKNVFRSMEEAEKALEIIKRGMV